MTEPRRVQLMPAKPVEKEKKLTKFNLSQRFDLTLAEPTTETCPEFSFLDLTRKSSKSIEKENGAGDDPFGDDEEDAKLRALALSFEQKYGAAAARDQGKKKKKYADAVDVFDLGDGYDENDPFVDNSEAYDELVPEMLTTKHGGFYINSGVLDFKVISGDSDDDFINTSSVKKKNCIISDSESDGAENIENTKPKKLKKSLFLKEVEKKIKKRKKIPGSADDERPPKKKKVINKDIKLKKKLGGAADLLNSPSSSNQVNGGINTKELPHSTQDKSNGLSYTDDEADMMDKVKCTPENAPPIPANLPSSLVENIVNIKKAAKLTAEGKQKFFSGPVNDMLLSIELACRQLSCSQRIGVFSHLTAFLPCSQQTLIKRAKKLRLNEADTKLRDPLQKLKDALGREMEGQLQRHHHECQAAQLAWQESNSKSELDAHSADSNEESEKKEGDKEKKKFRMPNKKFEWTDEIRRLVCDVVRVKMDVYENMKNKTQSADEYLTAFFEAEVKNLWPKGWMQSRTLFKESKSVHAKWTLSLKPKKALITSKPPQSVIPQTSDAAKVNLAASSQSLVMPDSTKEKQVSPVSQVSSSRSPFASPKSLSNSPPTQKPASSMLDYTSPVYQKSKPVSTEKTPVSSDKTWQAILSEACILSSSGLVPPKTTVTVSNQGVKLSTQQSLSNSSEVLNLSGATTHSKKERADNDDFFSMFEQYVSKDLCAESDLLSPSKSLKSDNISLSTKPGSHSNEKLVEKTDVTKALKAALFEKASSHSADSASNIAYKMTSTSVTKPSDSAINYSPVSSVAKSTHSLLNNASLLSFSASTVTSTLTTPASSTSGHPSQHKTNSSKDTKSVHEATNKDAFVKSIHPRSNVKVTPTIGSNTKINPSKMQWTVNLDAGKSKLSEPKKPNVSASVVPSVGIKSNPDAGSVTNRGHPLSQSQKVMPRSLPAYEPVSTANSESLPYRSIPVESYNTKTLNESYSKKVQQKQALESYTTKKPDVKAAFEAPKTANKPVHKSPSPLSVARQSQTGFTAVSSTSYVAKPVAQRHHSSSLSSGSSPPLQTSNTSPSRARQTSPQSQLTQAHAAYLQAQMMSSTYQQIQGSKTQSGVGQWALGGSTTPASPTADLLASFQASAAGLPSLPVQTSSALSLPGYTGLNLSDLARDSPVSPHYPATASFGSPEALSHLFSGRPATSMVPPSHQTQHRSSSKSNAISSMPIFDAPNFTTPLPFSLPFPDSTQQHRY